MPRASWQDRIVIEPDIHHGVPCIKGTRVPVTTVLGSLADGMTAEEIISHYPHLREADIAAALSYGG
ncbi:MAG: DUF433 domain-containing protein [Armatimonadota bacterium]|nr:DUF433 domain-containing protein [Armatimonadota bacterium]